MKITDLVHIERDGKREIERIIDIAAETSGTLSGMSYEDGVRAALDWIMGNQEETPFE